MPMPIQNWTKCTYYTRDQNATRWESNQIENERKRETGEQKLNTKRHFYWNRIVRMILNDNWFCLIIKLLTGLILKSSYATCSIASELPPSRGPGDRAFVLCMMWSFMRLNTKGFYHVRIERPKIQMWITTCNNWIDLHGDLKIWYHLIKSMFISLFSIEIALISISFFKGWVFLEIWRKFPTRIGSQRAKKTASQCISCRL